MSLITMIRVTGMDITNLLGETYPEEGRAA